VFLTSRHIIISVSIHSEGHRFMEQSSQRILTRSRVTGDGFFTREKLIWQRPVTSNVISWSSRADVIIDFLLHTPQQSNNAFQWARRPKIPLPFGDLDPHLTHGSLGPPKSTLQSAFWSIQPFWQNSQTWPTDRQTNTQTDQATPVCSNRPHLAIAAMRPKTNCDKVAFLHYVQMEGLTLMPKIFL